MSRLLYGPIIGMIVLAFGLWKQSSAEIAHDVRPCALCSPLTSGGVRDCSNSGSRAAVLARMTNGVLGGERSARRRARTNTSPRL